MSSNHANAVSDASVNLAHATSALLGAAGRFAGDYAQGPPESLGIAMELARLALAAWELATEEAAMMGGKDYDPEHRCPKCGQPPIAPGDGMGRFCSRWDGGCGWTWTLGDERTGRYEDV